MTGRHSDSPLQLEGRRPLHYLVLVTGARAPLVR